MSDPLDQVFEVLAASPLGHGELARLAERLAGELRNSIEFASFVNPAFEAAMDTTADLLEELGGVLTADVQLEDAPNLALLIQHSHTEA